MRENSKRSETFFWTSVASKKKSGNSVNKTGVKKDYEGFEVEKVEF